MKLIYSGDEVAEMLGCSRATVARMEKDGRLHRLYQLPGVFYSRESVLALCEYKEPKHSPAEWEELKAENAELKAENAEYKKRLARVQVALNGPV